MYRDGCIGIPAKEAIGYRSFFDQGVARGVTIKGSPRLLRLPAVAFTPLSLESRC